MANTPRKESSHNVDFAKGGDTPMFGKGDRTVTAPQEQAGAEKSATTAKHNDGGSGEKYASGGSTKMHGYAPSLPAQAGITGAR